MGFYQFTCEQKVNANLEQVWDFISSPQNLKEITPDHMGFDITSKQREEKMYEGMIISYLVSPILGIKTAWVTEITHVKEKSCFVDEQRMGPYTMWHHQHHIEEIPGGVMMRDIVSYIPPLGIFGSIANKLFIHSKLEEIFDYRLGAVERKFGAFRASES